MRVLSTLGFNMRVHPGCHARIVEAQQDPVEGCLQHCGVQEGAVGRRQVRRTSMRAAGGCLVAKAGPATSGVCYGRGCRPGRWGQQPWGYHLPQTRLTASSPLLKV